MIEHNGKTYEGAVIKDGKIVCDKCGHDKGKSISFLDGEDWWQYVIACEKCGNEITVTGRREEK